MSTSSGLTPYIWSTTTPSSNIVLAVLPSAVNNIVNDRWLLDSAADAVDARRRHQRDDVARRRVKRRRSLNVSDGRLPKVATLYSAARRRFVAVGPDNDVRLASRQDSAFAVLELLFWCSLTSSPFYPCAPPSRDISRSPDDNGRSRRPPSASFIYSLVLLRFVGADSLLCVNGTGHVYALPRSLSLSVDECVFKHDIIYDRNDVYYSWKFPRHRCRQHRVPSARHRVSCHNTSASTKRWFLGATRTGNHLRTYRVQDYAPTKLPRRALFIQRWINRDFTSGGFYPAVLNEPSFADAIRRTMVTSSTPAAEDLRRPVTGNRRRSGRPESRADGRRPRERSAWRRGETRWRSVRRWADGPTLRGSPTGSRRRLTFLNFLGADPWRKPVDCLNLLTSCHLANATTTGIRKR